MDTIRLPISDEEIRRYSRQILLAEVGGAGQRRLLAAHLCIVGAGEACATANICARYLAAAGVTVLAAPPADGAVPEVRVASAASAAEAWVQGAFAAVEAQKQVLGIGRAAPAPRLELPQ
jgi:hypothetical protein